MCADGQQSATVVEILWFGRRLPVLVDDPAFGHTLAAVDRYHELAFGDHRCRHVHDHGVASGDGDADGDRISRQPAIAAAEGRDAQAIRGIQEMQRHLACRGGELGPVANPAEMAAVTQADHRDSAFRRFRRPEAARELPDHLPEAAITIDDRDGVALEYDRRRLIRFQPTVAHPFQVFADAQHAVRVVADQIGVDQPPRDRCGFHGVATGGMHDRGDQRDEPGRGNDAHVSESPAPPSEQCPRENRNRNPRRPA